GGGGRHGGVGGRGGGGRRVSSSSPTIPVFALVIPAVASARFALGICTSVAPLSFRELPAAAGRSRRMRPLAAIRPNVLADPFPTSSLRGRNAIRLGKVPGTAMPAPKWAPTHSHH